MGSLKLSTVSGEKFWFGVLVDEKDRLLESAFNPSRKKVMDSLTRRARKVTGTRPALQPHPLAREMVNLYKGRRVRRVSLDAQYITPFQNRVYQYLRRIPKGRVTTYGMIAEAMKSGPRAVGNAVATNPWSLFVPCHRVVPSDLSVGNYSMNGRISHDSCATKAALLEKEGVPFQDGKVLGSSLWKPGQARP
jgi:O-6-methylguanine DNA methyltransferase